jgi:hypothetical protein
VSEYRHRQMIGVGPMDSEPPADFDHMECAVRTMYSVSGEQAYEVVQVYLDADNEIVGVTPLRIIATDLEALEEAFRYIWYTVVLSVNAMAAHGSIPMEDDDE